MNEATAPVLEGDNAWASINTPLSEQELRAFCLDIERLFRINPMLEFKEWQDLDQDRYLLHARNISQQTPFETETELRVTQRQDGLQIDFANGIKSRTTFKIDSAPQGSKLTIIDCYDGLDEQERERRLDEVDKSLVAWAEYLQRFIVLWKRWSKYAWWRWYMRRVWQPMKPSGRRITYILLWISVVEIALILLGVAIYFIEYD